jgi:hypothetical protein
MGVNKVAVVTWMKSCYMGGRTADPSTAHPRGKPGQAGQVGFAPNEQTKSVVAHLRRSDPLRNRFPSPSAGLTFGGRPSGPCLYGDLCRVSSPSTCHRPGDCSHGAPGQAG